MRTVRQRRGGAAEGLAAEWLAARGWRIVGRNVKIGRDEIDIVALDPGPPAELVCVEVRSASSAAFGSPEERMDRAKVSHLYRAMAALPLATTLPRRVDLVVVDSRGGRTEVRLLRRLEPAS